MSERDRAAQPVVGLRAVAGPDLDEVGEDAALAERIRDEIRRDGPMPFDRFMWLALYDPDGGYYRSAEARPGRAGDFLTAPELHPIFGATLAASVTEVWDRLGRPDPFVVQEHGAGEGALAVAILDGLEDPDLRAAIRYVAIEVDDRRLASLRERLIAAGHADALRPPIDDAIDGFDGIVLANEVLDVMQQQNRSLATGPMVGLQHRAHLVHQRVRGRQCIGRRARRAGGGALAATCANLRADLDVIAIGHDRAGRAQIEATVAAG